MKVSILTLGCRVNQSESNDIEALLKENGITIVDLKENPDYCIINTCSVTSRGDYSSRQLIRRAVNTGAKVIITGCYAQLNPEKIRKIAEGSHVVDIQNKREIVRIISRKSTEVFHASFRNSRPYLKVQDGCDMYCSYCTVPLARGRSRSLAEDEVIRRALLIEEKGYSEIVLTGIHLGSYGRDLQGAIDIKVLIKSLLRETTIPRIRISSMEINEVDDEFVEILNDPRICRHVHLPLQSGSNRILHAMNRHYTREYYKKTVDTIAGKIENIAIGTDILVGFPGEDEEDFKDTVQVIRELPFAYLHIFPYSPRPKTRASYMTNRVRGDVIKERVIQMQEIGNYKRKDYIASQMTRMVDVVVEEKYDDTYTIGTSSTYIKVLIPGISFKKASVVNAMPVREHGNMIEAVAV